MATSTAPAPSAAPPTTSDRFWARKAKLMEQLACRDLFLEWKRLDDEWQGLSAGRPALQHAISLAKADADAIETQVALEADGKNAEERKAQKVKALRESVAFAGAATILHRNEAALLDLDLRLTSLDRQAARVKYEIRYRTEVIRLFGGE